MKRNIIRIAVLLFSVFIMTGITACSYGSCVKGCVAACGIPFEEPLPEFENEIYRYAVKTYDDGSKICYILGLTDLGKSKTELVLPEYIDGIPVRGISYGRQDGLIFEREGSFSSKNLHKLYIPYNLTNAQWGDDYQTTNCPNGYAVVWKDLRFQMLTPNGHIIGYNLLSEYLGDKGREGILANVSYMYNYENAQDDGYYWVDSFNSDLISFIPPEPTREGYTFGGWYKEPECINKWDFATDKTGEEIPLRSYKFENYDISKITYLYAKWI